MMKWLDEMIDRVNAGGISGEWATQSQVAATSAVDKLELPAIPDDAVVDLVGCLIDEVERLKARLREQTLQTQQTAEQIHSAVIEALGDAIPDGIDANGHPTEQVVATTISTMRCDHEMLKDEIERLQKDRSRSENELDRLREWVAEVEDGYDKQKAEIERLRDQHDTYVEMVEQLTRQLDAAAVLLRRPGRVEWGYDAEENAMAYFLDGKFAGPTIRHAIRMAAKEG